MAEVRLERIQKTGDCEFKGDFSANGTPIGYMFTVRLNVRCEEGSFLFFFSSGCEIKRIDVLTETDQYVERATVGRDRYHVFKVEKKEEREEGDDCRVLTFRWLMWEYFSLDPVKPFEFDGEFDAGLLGGIGGKGKAQGKLETIPNKSGLFQIRVCCQEGEDGCQPECTLL